MRYYTALLQARRHGLLVITPATHTAMRTPLPRHFLDIAMPRRWRCRRPLMWAARRRRAPALLALVAHEMSRATTTTYDGLPSTATAAARGLALFAGDARRYFTPRSQSGARRACHVRAGGREHTSFELRSGRRRRRAAPPTAGPHTYFSAISACRSYGRASVGC